MANIIDKNNKLYNTPGKNKNMRQFGVAHEI